MKIRCEYCNSKYEGGQEYCFSCGAPLPIVKNEQSAFSDADIEKLMDDKKKRDAKERRRKTVRIILVFIALLFLLVAIIVDSF
ncbi:MAG: hypothetical protein FWF37_01275 [Chloroflexi bacterium]|nr:hypothetical protein [Chloroflexota bacterium]